MRALAGPLTRDGAVLAHAGDLDVRCFARHGADIAFDPAREPLEALWHRLPDRWLPECLIWWSPEYSLVPDGIERCPVPSIAVLGDWNLGVWTTAPLLEAFDLVVTDRLGVRTLASQLDVPVEHWPVFSFDPRVHRRHPAVERDIDVLFVGNLNHEVQSERAPWLARLARLGARHHVVLTSGVYGAAYAALLNRARIVWNRSIRGELNMRAYEAPACGALLFVEEENLEVRDVFRDGESCVLYDATSLDVLLAQHLAHPERAARIAEAGHARVQRETYRHHLERLLDRATRVEAGPRQFATLPAWRRHYWLGLHALASADPERLPAATAQLIRAAGADGDGAAVAAALGAVAVDTARGLPDAVERERALVSAMALFETSLQAHPADVVSRMNLAWVAASLGQAARAHAEWCAARTTLARHAPFPVDRIPAPFPFDRFRVAWERAAVTPDVDERIRGFAPLLVARVTAGLADLETDAARRVDWWAASVEAAPGVDSNVRGLAAALESAGEESAALDAYRRALELNPFDWTSRLVASRLAETRGDHAALAELLTQGQALAAASALQHAASPVGTA
jgi:tetratricopeptide (TPR) repeat protein